MGLIVSFLASLLGQKKSILPGNKFLPQDGITLYDQGSSPNARKIRIFLLEKKLPFSLVEVNLMAGEQKTNEFKRINPNGKVPVLVVKNVKGAPDCTLFESQVIMEFLDKVFPGKQPLFPSDGDDRRKLRSWQHWEAALSENFFPLVRNNFLPYLLRMIHKNREAFIASLPKNQPKNVRQDYIGLYDGEGILSHEDLKFHALACYHQLMTLEKALQNKQFLLGDKLSAADITVYSRVVMYHWVGLPIPRTAFPNCYSYLQRLSKVKSVSASLTGKVKFASLLFTYVPLLVVKVGNWKSGKQHRRFYGSAVLDRAVSESGAPSPVDFYKTDGKKRLIFCYPASLFSWQHQLLLSIKNQDYATVEGDIVDLLGRPLYSDGVCRIQDGDILVCGITASLAHLSSLPGPSVIPEDAVREAEVWCWQGWTQTWYAAELYPLLEATVFSDVMRRSYSKDEALSQLLQLRDDPFYASQFTTILKIFAFSLPENDQRLEEIGEMIGNDHLNKITQEQIIQYHTLVHDRLKYLDDIVQEKQYLVGESISLADICVFCMLLLLPYADIKISSHKFPNVGHWMTMLRSNHTAFQTVTDSVTQQMLQFH